MHFGQKLRLWHLCHNRAFNADNLLLAPRSRALPSPVIFTRRSKHMRVPLRIKRNGSTPYITCVGKLADLHKAFFISIRVERLEKKRKERKTFKWLVGGIRSRRSGFYQVVIKSSTPSGKQWPYIWKKNSAQASAASPCNHYPCATATTCQST